MYSEEELSALREKVSVALSGYRLSHTLGVEDMSAKLGELYMPEKIDVLRAAALLHDITKENTYEKQLQICEKLGIIVTSESKSAPKTLHAITAAGIIPSYYPSFASPEVLSAVRWHTTGRKDMSLCEKLIYLADYIEEGRTFSDCVKLRKYFFDASPDKMTFDERLIHLDRVLILSFDMTMRGLIDEGAVIDPNTSEARNSLIMNSKAV